MAGISVTNGQDKSTSRTFGAFPGRQRRLRNQQVAFRAPNLFGLVGQYRVTRSVSLRVYIVGILLGKATSSKA